LVSFTAATVIDAPVLGEIKNPRQFELIRGLYVNLRNLKLNVRWDHSLKVRRIAGQHPQQIAGMEERTIV
jgi:hypothetical protein